MKSEDRTGCEERYTPAISGYVYGGPDGVRVYRQAIRYEGTARLQAAGEFDINSVTCLRRALADARNDRATRIRLDLTSVTFGDSSFLGVLVRANRNPGALVLTGPLPHHLRRLFDLTGTTCLFHFEP